MSIYYECPTELFPATSESAAIDLRSIENVVINPWNRTLISTGLRFELHPGTFGLIRSRSGLSVKGIDVGAGVIDSDYRGEIKVLLCNMSSEPFEVKDGDRIAQMIILKHEDYSKLERVESIDVDTNRGEGGFGSTGQS